MSAYDRIKVDTFTALNDYVIVRDLNFDEKLSHGGIIILSGDKKLEGIHPRWGEVGVSQRGTHAYQGIFLYSR